MNAHAVMEDLRYDRELETRACLDAEVTFEQLLWMLRPERYCLEDHELTAQEVERLLDWIERLLPALRTVKGSILAVRALEAQRRRQGQHLRLVREEPSR